MFLKRNVAWVVIAVGVWGTACSSGPTNTPTGGGGTGGESTSSQGGGGSGTGATGGGGSGGGLACMPGESKACYSGPAATEGVGLCKSGTQLCKANGEGFGPCNGEVVPVDETCATPGDDDCDGQTNEGGVGCACAPGSMSLCYSGPPETQDVGPCVGGSQTCNDDGMGYGPCEGEVVPADETCLTPADEDCDGATNEEGEGCVCVPGTNSPCYQGPPGTENVGACQGGMATCTDDGTAFGPCVGQVTPTVETCATAEDDDCDGQTNEEGAGCQCFPGTMLPCYTGPTGTLGIGACAGGMVTCGPSGMPEGPCVGEVLPSVETCVTAFDDDCDGQVNEDGAGCSCVPGSIKSCYSGPVGTEGVGACKAGTQSCLPDGTGYGACAGEVLPSTEVCATLANEDCATTADCGEHVWSKAFGAAGEQQGYAVARDPSNNVLMTGRFNGTMTFGGGTLVSVNGYDVFLVKLDPSGNHLWSKRFGDPSIYQEGIDVATDAMGNVYLTGYFEGTINFGGAGFTSGGLTDIFLAKFDSSGNHLWSKAFSAPGPQLGVALAVDASGNVALAANGFNTVDFGGGALPSAGSYDMYLAKFDTSGNHLWSKRFGSPQDDRAQGLSADSAGNLIFVGRAEGAIDFGSGALPGAGGLDLLIAKLDPSGALLWNKRLGDAAGQFASDVAVDGSNNIVVTGGFESSIDFGGGAMTAAGALDVFVAKLSPAGAHLYSKRFGAANVNVAFLSVAVTPSGDAVLGGQLGGAIDFGGGVLSSAGMGSVDALVVRLKPDGAHAWSHIYGDGTNQTTAGVAVDGTNHVLMTGYFEGSTNFGGGALTSQGGLDIFIAKLAP